MASNRCRLASTGAPCICSVCNCGAHKCPPTPLGGNHEDLQTMYRQSFTGQVAPVERPRPRDRSIVSLPFDATSTTRQDFKWPAPHSPTKSAQHAAALSRSLPFEGTSTQRQDFPKWSAPPAKSAKAPESPLAQPENRDFQSEARASFATRGGRPAPSAAPKQTIPVQLPFEAVSTHHADFQQWQSRPPHPIRHDKGAMAMREDRDFSTESRKQYDRKAAQTCPARAVAVSVKAGPGHVPLVRLPDTAAGQPVYQISRQEPRLMQ